MFIYWPLASLLSLHAIIGKKTKKTNCSAVYIFNIYFLECAKVSVLKKMHIQTVSLATSSFCRYVLNFNPELYNKSATNIKPFKFTYTVVIRPWMTPWINKVGCDQWRGNNKNLSFNLYFGDRIYILLIIGSMQLKHHFRRAYVCTLHLLVFVIVLFLLTYL